jgi:hypothetical protein
LVYVQQGACPLIYPDAGVFIGGGQLENSVKMVGVSPGCAFFQHKNGEVRVCVIQFGKTIVCFVELYLSKSFFIGVGNVEPGVVLFYFGGLPAAAGPFFGKAEEANPFAGLYVIAAPQGNFVGFVKHFVKNFSVVSESLAVVYRQNVHFVSSIVKAPRRTGRRELRLFVS